MVDNAPKMKGRRRHKNPGSTSPEMPAAGVIDVSTLTASIEAAARGAVSAALQPQQQVSPTNVTMPGAATVGVTPTPAPQPISNTTFNGAATGSPSSPVTEEPQEEDLDLEEVTENEPEDLTGENDDDNLDADDSPPPPPPPEGTDRDRPDEDGEDGPENRPTEAGRNYEHDARGYTGLEKIAAVTSWRLRDREGKFLDRTKERLALAGIYLASARWRPFAHRITRDRLSFGMAKTPLTASYSAVMFDPSLGVRGQNTILLDDDDAPVFDLKGSANQLLDAFRTEENGPHIYTEIATTAAVLNVSMNWENLADNDAILNRFLDVSKDLAAKLGTASQCSQILTDQPDVVEKLEKSLQKQVECLACITADPPLPSNDKLMVGGSNRARLYAHQISGEFGTVRQSFEKIKTDGIKVAAASARAQQILTQHIQKIEAARAAGDNAALSQALTGFKTFANANLGRLQNAANAQAWAASAIDKAVNQHIPEIIERHTFVSRAIRPSNRSDTQYDVRQGAGLVDIDELSEQEWKEVVAYKLHRVNDEKGNPIELPRDYFPFDNALTSRWGTCLDAGDQHHKDIELAQGGFIRDGDGDLAKLNNVNLSQHYKQVGDQWVKAIETLIRRGDYNRVVAALTWCTFDYAANLTDGPRLGGISSEFVGRLDGLHKNNPKIWTKELCQIIKDLKDIQDDEGANSWRVWRKEVKNALRNFRFHGTHFNELQNTDSPGEFEDAMRFQYGRGPVVGAIMNAIPFWGFGFSSEKIKARRLHKGYPYYSFWRNTHQWAETAWKKAGGKKSFGDRIRKAIENPLVHNFLVARFAWATGLKLKREDKTKTKRFFVLSRKKEKIIKEGGKLIKDPETNYIEIKPEKRENETGFGLALKRGTRVFKRVIKLPLNPVWFATGATLVGADMGMNHYKVDVRVPGVGWRASETLGDTGRTMFNVSAGIAEFLPNLGIRGLNLVLEDNIDWRLDIPTVTWGDAEHQGAAGPNGSTPSGTQQQGGPKWWENGSDSSEDSSSTPEEKLQKIRDSLNIPAASEPLGNSGQEPSTTLDFNKQSPTQNEQTEEQLRKIREMIDIPPATPESEPG